jgi:hypothetical protein
MAPTPGILDQYDGGLHQFSTYGELDIPPLSIKPFNYLFHKLG